jgi:hypothetical protein
MIPQMLSREVAERAGEQVRPEEADADDDPRRGAGVEHQER